jgi:hypothetical protein
MYIDYREYMHSWDSLTRLSKKSDLAERCTFQVSSQGCLKIGLAAGEDNSTQPQSNIYCRMHLPASIQSVTRQRAPKVATLYMCIGSIFRDGGNRARMGDGGKNLLSGPWNFR